MVDQVQAVENGSEQCPEFPGEGDNIAARDEQNHAT